MEEENEEDDDEGVEGGRTCCAELLHNLAETLCRREVQGRPPATADRPAWSRG